MLVDSWWDCEVEADHAPGEQSVLAFHWRGSLGKLAYRRRFRVQFAEGLDYVGMAKLYREQARREGLVRTLAEKAAENPGLRHDLDAVLYRWPAWNPDDGPGVLDDLQALRDMGFAIKFFFPEVVCNWVCARTGTADDRHVRLAIAAAGDAGAGRLADAGRIGRGGASARVQHPGVYRPAQSGARRGRTTTMTAGRAPRMAGASMT